MTDIDVTGATPTQLIDAGQRCMRAGGEVWINCYPDGRTIVSNRRAIEPGVVSTGIVTDDGHALERQPALTLGRI